MPKRKIIYAVLFSLYMLEFQMFLYIEGMVDGVLSIRHYIAWSLVSLGFISFWIIRSIISNLQMRKITIMIINITFALSVLFTILPENDHLKSTAVLLASLLIGCLGGAVYFFSACEYCMDKRMGLIMAISTSVPYIIQFFLTSFFQNKYTQIFIMLLLFLVITYVATKHPRDYILEDMLPFIGENPQYDEKLLFDKKKILTVFLVMLVIGVYMEQTWSSSALSGEVDMYGLPRLFVIFGYFYTGFFTDYREHKYMEIASLLTFSFFALGTYSSGNIYLRLSIFYFLAGVYTAYLTAAFWYIAPRTKTPELWASLGRVLSLLEGIFGIILLHVVNTGLVKLFLESLFVFAITYASYRISLDNRDRKFAFAGASGNTDSGFCLEKRENMHQEHGEKAIAESSQKKESEQFKDFCNLHRFTPRECEVMQILLNSDESMKIVAEKLGISERMLYRYMNSLYEKTGTQSRASLLKFYYR